jgi:hypothetical protein
MIAVGSESKQCTFRRVYTVKQMRETKLRMTVWTSRAKMRQNVKGFES